MSIRYRSLVIIVLTVLAAVLALLPITDEIGQSHVDNAFKRALLAFAIARGLNGVISVAQGTEIALQPAGIGVNFTPGQILDPVNDLVERFSWIMMLASSSLGIQKVLLSMSAWQGLLIGVVICAVVVVLVHLLAPLARWRHMAARLFLFVLILRFMMPAISIANDWVYRAFLEADFIAASASLDDARESIGQINAQILPVVEDESAGFVERTRRAYQQALDAIDINKQLEEYRAVAEAISENTIRLVVVFLMQTLVFPLVFLFVVYGLAKRLTVGRRNRDP